MAYIAGKVILQVSTNIDGQSCAKKIAFSETETVDRARDLAAQKFQLSNPERYGLFAPPLPSEKGFFLEFGSTLAKYNLSTRAGIEIRDLPKETRIVMPDGETRLVTLDRFSAVYDLTVMVQEKLGLPPEYLLHVQSEFDSNKSIPLDPNKSLNEQSSPDSTLIVKKGKKGLPKKKPVREVAPVHTGRTNQFGAPLEAVAVVGEYGGLPPVVAKCIDVIEEKGLTTEGIFRVSGNQAEVQQYKAQFDGGVDPDITKCSSPHVAASLLKLYFREMSEPLLTYRLYELFIDIYTQCKHDADVRIIYYKVLVDTLPIVRRILLFRLLRFLWRVVEAEELNLMPIHNVATVFGPNVLKSEDDSPAIMIQDTPAVNAIMCDMMQFRDQIIENAEYDFVAVARATFEYRGQTDSELSFNVQDVVFVVKEDDSGWWEGEVNGQYGFFPKNYVQSLFSVTPRLGPEAQDAIPEVVAPKSKSTLLHVAASPVSSKPAVAPRQKESATAVSREVQQQSQHVQQVQQAKRGDGMSKKKFLSELADMKQQMVEEQEGRREIEAMCERMAAELKNVRQRMQEMNQQGSSRQPEVSERMLRDFDSLKAEHSGLQKEVRQLKDANRALSLQLANLSSSKTALEATVAALEKRVDQLSQSHGQASSSSQSSFASASSLRRPPPTNTTSDSSAGMIYGTIRRRTLTKPTSQPPVMSPPPQRSTNKSESIVCDDSSEPSAAKSASSIGVRSSPSKFAPSSPSASFGQNSGSSLSQVPSSASSPVPNSCAMGGVGGTNGAGRGRGRGAPPRRGVPGRGRARAPPPKRASSASSVQRSPAPIRNGSGEDSSGAIVTTSTGRGNVRHVKPAPPGGSRQLIK